MELASLNYFKRAHEIDPTVFSFFNIGVILRYQDIEKGGGGHAGEPQLWKEVLAEFLRIRHDPNDLKMDSFRQVAMAMLQDNYSQPRPQLFIPGK